MYDDPCVTTQTHTHTQKRGVCVLSTVIHTQTQNFKHKKYKNTKLQKCKNTKIQNTKTPLQLRGFMACIKLLNCLTPPSPQPYNPTHPHPHPSVKG